MPVEVTEAAHVHESLILGLAERLTAAGDDPLGEVVDLLLLSAEGPG